MDMPEKNPVLHIVKLRISIISHNALVANEDTFLTWHRHIDAVL
jgi:hypothetical protein